MTPASAEAEAGPHRGWAEHVSLGSLFGAFLVAAYLIYAPAIAGRFVSDDHHYVETNAYVHDLDAENLLAILSPVGPVPLIVENYEPVHLLLHAIGWKLFGSDVRGHHLLNVVLHALASCMLVALFRRSHVPAAAAALGGAFFLAHPANVEAVAWISQLKTSAAMVLCLGAVLAHPRRPALGALLFALGLLAKPMTAVAMFFVVVLGFARTTRSHGIDRGASTGRAGGESWAWGWIGVWGIALALFASAEIAAFAQTAGRHPPSYADVSIRLLSTIANAGRYLVMATTSYGTSTFHEPVATTSFFDAWLIGALVAAVLVAWRMVVVLRARREEGAYWVWAVVSFAPISGVLSLPFPMADRYLYFILPGLIGAVLLAAPAWAERLSTRFRALTPRRLSVMLQIAAVITIASFGLRSHARSHVWLDAYTMTADSALHYPDGRSALIIRAVEAARAGRADEAVASLRVAHERGYDKLDQLLTPDYARIQNAASFVALKREWAREWVETYSNAERSHQPQLMMLSQAYIVLGEFEAARRTMHRAIYAGGPMTDYLYAALEELNRVEMRHSSRAASEPH